MSERIDAAIAKLRPDEYGQYAESIEAGDLALEVVRLRAKIASLEGAVAKKDGKLKSISEIAPLSIHVAGKDRTLEYAKELAVEALAIQPKPEGAREDQELAALMELAEAASEEYRIEYGKKLIKALDKLDALRRGAP